MAESSRAAVSPTETTNEYQDLQPPQTPWNGQSGQNEYFELQYGLLMEKDNGSVYRERPKQQPQITRRSSENRERKGDDRGFTATWRKMTKTKSWEDPGEPPNGRWSGWIQGAYNLSSTEDRYSEASQLGVMLYLEASVLKHYSYSRPYRHDEYVGT